MAGGLLPQPKQMIQDSAWNPGIAYQWYTYAAGTLTPKATYQDAALTIPNTNPIVANARGEMVVYGSGTYRIIAKDSLGNTLWDRDSIDALIGGAALSASDGASLVGYDDSTLDVVVKSRIKRAVNTLGELRGLSKLKYTRATALGGVTLGDGGGGEYWYDATDSTSADTGGSVVVGTDGGRWKLIDHGRNSGQFFSELGAVPQKFGDRLFVGDATKHNAKDAISQTDWLTTYELAKGRAGGSLMYSTAGVTNGATTRAANTMMIGAQAKNLLAYYNAIGLRTLAANNSTLSNVSAYAGYFEAYRDATATGGAYGLEIDTMNYASVVEIDPYQQFNGQTIALQIAGGGEFASSGQFASSAAINIRKNGSTYERGIIFGSDALTGATGTAGLAPAIVFGNGHQIMWYGAANVSTSSISCTGTTFAGGIEQRFLDGAVNWNNSNNKPLFQIATNASHVNYLSIRSGATGAAAQMTAQGDDANIDIQLVPKGTGVVHLGAYTVGALTQVGYISVKDSTGSVRRLMVG